MAKEAVAEKPEEKPEYNCNCSPDCLGRIDIRKCCRRSFEANKEDERAAKKK